MFQFIKCNHLYSNTMFVVPKHFFALTSKEFSAQEVLFPIAGVAGAGTAAWGHPEPQKGRPN